MIGLDTNVLARYYIQDVGDAEAEKQRDAARRLIESGQPLKVCKTVLLELEWVMRGYYGFSAAEIIPILEHLLALPQVMIEDREAVRGRRSRTRRPGLIWRMPCTMRAIGIASAWRPSMTASLLGGYDGWACCPWLSLIHI